MQFINDASAQTGGSLLSFNTFYSTKTNPSIKLNSNSGVYNPSDNVIKIFTNNIDALTIDGNQVLSGNGTGFTNLNYNAILNKPDLSIYATTTSLSYLSNTSFSILNSHTTSISNLNISTSTLFNNYITTSALISNLNATSTTLLGLVNGHTTSISNLTTTSNTIFTNVNSLSTSSILSINNINATSTTLLGLVNGHTTSISNLTTTSNTIFTNVNSLSTSSILSINNINATSTTLFNLINDHTTSISNLTTTSNTIFTNLNALSTNSILSINNLNTTSTTLLGLVNGHTTSISNLNISTSTLFTTKESALTFSSPFTRNTNTISLNYDNSTLGVNASGNLTVLAGGTINYNTNQFDMTNNVLNIKSIAMTQITGGTPTYTGGVLTNITNSLYITYASNGTITFPINTICNVLVVGAGGKGKKGGGGAGEVIYLTDYLFNAGTYNISIGLDSLITSNRITKLFQGATDIIKAFGGGDGGYDDVYQSLSNNTYTFYSSTSLVINKTYSTTYPAGTYIFSQNQGLLKIDTTIINTYPSLTGLSPYYWFKFNGNLNDSGSSGTLRNCTATGTLTYNTYDISNITASNCIIFGSIDPYSVWNTYGMTFSFWIKGTATTGSSFYLFRFADGPGTKCLETIFTKTNDTLTFSIKGASSYSYNYTANLLDNNYHHIVWSINSTGVWYIYIDNTLIINGTITNIINQISIFYKYIGYVTSTNTGTHSISVKDFRIYRGVLTSTQVNDLYLARCDISISPTSGGSGGGGSLNQTGATAGIANNANSQLNNGYGGTSTQGGDGGSALSTGNGYTEIITGINLVVGKGGTGGTSSSVPATKTNYGDGGDGNNGNAYQGLLIIKVPSFAYKSNFTGYTDWGKVENIVTSYPLSMTTGNTLTLKYDSSLSLDGSNNLKVNNPCLWVTNGSNMYYSSGNIGIGNNTPLYKLDVNGDLNAINIYGNGSNISNINYNNISNKPALFSGSYIDLTNKPTLFSGSYIDLTNKPTLFSGSYVDLTSKPTLFSGSYTDLTSKPTLFSGSYVDLTNKPINFQADWNTTIINKPTLMGVVSYTDLINKPTNFQADWNTTIINKPTLFSGSYIDLTSKPTLFSGSYIDLTNKPINFQADWNTTIINKPTLFSGSYTDLTNKPTITNSQWTTSGSNIYYNSGNVGIGTNAANCKLNVYGAMNVSGASPYAVSNGYNTGAGCLTIGDINTSYGGSINQTWGTNMGLLMETIDNTEIAIHDAGTRLASFLYYASAANAIYIGRNMGWGASAVAIPYYLHVFGSLGTTTENSVFVYYDPYQSNGSIGVNSSVTVGLIVESRAYFKSSAIYVSDERIKMNIQDIDDDSALQKILSIQPKTYEYIDKYNKGNGTVYGFISQQIRTIIPEAVSLQSDFIPNVLSLLQCSGTTITTNEHTNKLNVNDEIKITSMDNNETTYKIKEINENKITIDKEIEGDKCFVYGKKINDFHALDKNYIYTLNVSATQELYKLIQQQNLIIQDLQNRLSILENK